MKQKRNFTFVFRFYCHGFLEVVLKHRKTIGFKYLLMITWYVATRLWDFCCILSLPFVPACRPLLPSVNQTPRYTATMSQTEIISCLWIVVQYTEQLSAQKCRRYPGHWNLTMAESQSCWAWWHWPRRNKALVALPSMSSACQKQQLSFLFPLQKRPICKAQGTTLRFNAQTQDRPQLTDRQVPMDFYNGELRTLWWMSLTKKLRITWSQWSMATSYCFNLRALAPLQINKVEIRNEDCWELFAKLSGAVGSVEISLLTVNNFTACIIVWHSHIQ